LAQIIGKTVYILGAGASVHTEAPLLRDFLVKARLLKDGKYPPFFQDSFNKVFRWIDTLRGSSYYVEFDLDNLEHVFSLADMSRQLGSPGGEEIFSSLGDIIAETLDGCRIPVEKGKHGPDKPYSNFVNNLLILNDRRGRLVGLDPATSLKKDVIITFNYDVMLDYAMTANRSFVYSYCLTEEPKPGIFPILKLHGSVNWASCSGCGNQLQVIEPILPYDLDVGIVDSIKSIEFKMVTEILQKKRCENCDKAGALKPILIPPTWSKAVSKTVAAKVWASAVKEIKEAFQIVVIGYSMPPTDTFFQYLLTLGLTSNSQLHRVVVVNKDETDDFRDRYKKVFARSLDDRGRLIFIRPERGAFTSFITAGMIDIGGEI